ncbi:MAG: helix-turn-helix transcriptional regulator [Hyphomicrobiales bacterium]|nr:helix-turn-helix transcriptional regulator [Hyphomicrobiales bacterium]
MLGLRQETLAEQLGLSFQQVYRYETGDVRITAGRLLKISQLLDVPVSYFFEGLGTSTEPREDAETALLTKACATTAGMRIVRSVAALEDENIRRKIADLIEAVAESGHSV